jgi:hypothetical protein
LAKNKLFTYEEELALTEILLSDSWSLITKLVEFLAGSQSESVLKYNLDDGPDGLIIAKARHEGAQALLQRVKQYKVEARKRMEKEQEK